jgi:hypothetical protein
MTAAEADALAYWVAWMFLTGYSVGLIAKLIIGRES